jgi:hypothetical protein
VADNKFILKFSGDTTQLQSAVQQANGVMTGFANSIKAIGGTMAAGFAVSQIGGFVLDVSKLAGEAEGVRAAFEKLPASTQLMLDLKEATKGTVSELDLMKRTVMAANFGISLKALPDLLEFAAVRAKQTGQSVDYLVDSIVTGIGRKSVLILDNLGISAAAINEELKLTPDYAEAVGNIAAREMAKMGEMSENASTKVERLGASFENLKVAIGDAANGTGVLGSAIDELTKSVDIAASSNLSFWEKLAYYTGGSGVKSSLIIKEYTEQVTKAFVEQKKANDITDTASVLLKDLGLDYQAVMNVAGDNADVLLIWAEMQKLAAERTVVATETVKKQGKAIEDLSYQYKILADLAPDMNLLNDSISKMNFDPVSSMKFDVDVDPETIDTKTKAIFDRLASRGERFREAIAATNQIITYSVQDTIAGFASAIGDMASGVGGTELLAASLLGGIGAMAIQLGQLAIASGIAIAGIKKALMSLNPVVAIAGGIALVALGKIVSNKAKSIGSGGGGGGGSFSGGSEGLGQSGGFRRENLGQRVELVFAGDAGKTFKKMLVEQNRVDSRSRS